MTVTEAPPAVEVAGLSKRYGDREVLRDVTFTVRRGEIFGLLGPNGAGKTTTLEILEGFRDATSGRVRVLGFDPATHDVELLLRVIVETMIEAANADGGLVLGSHGELARAGDPDSGTQRLDLSLLVGGEPFGRVTLTGSSFDEDQVETAEALEIGQHVTFQCVGSDNWSSGPRLKHCVLISVRQRNDVVTP